MSMAHCSNDISSFWLLKDSSKKPEDDSKKPDQPKPVESEPVESDIPKPDETIKPVTSCAINDTLFEVIGFVI